jgi:hypothetical protein
VCGEKSDCEDNKENDQHLFQTTPTAPRKFKSRKNLELTDKFSPRFASQEVGSSSHQSTPGEASFSDHREEGQQWKVLYEITPLKDRNRNVCVVGVSHQDEEKRFCMPKKRWLREASRQMAQQISEAVVESEDSCSVDYSAASSGVYFVPLARDDDDEDPRNARLPSPIQPPVVLDPSSSHRVFFDDEDVDGLPGTSSSDMLGAMALVALRTSSVPVSPPRNDSPLNLTVPSYQ